MIDSEAMITNNFKMRLKISEFEVLHSGEMPADSSGSETVRVDPPIDGDGIDALMDAALLEIDGGRLLSFMTPRIAHTEKEGKLRVFVKWEHDEQGWHPSTR